MQELLSYMSKINLGYPCLNLTLRDTGVISNRGMIRRTFLEKGLQYASQLTLQNVHDLLKIVDWNLQNDITVFRVTSDLFPWSSEYKLKALPDFKEIRSVLEEIGKQPIRLTTHPGPFNKLAGSDQTLKITIKELEDHSEIFDLMNLKPSHLHKINIHVGGAYDDKNETLIRFAKNFKRLSKNLRARLTVENDDKQGLYTVADLLPLHERTGIPIVFDYFHHKLHPGKQTEEEAFNMAFKTWRVKPVFHYSSSRREKEDPLSKKEAHSDWVHEPINTYGKEPDIVLETKMKELSLMRFRDSLANYDQMINVM